MPEPKRPGRGEPPRQGDGEASGRVRSAARERGRHVAEPGERTARADGAPAVVFGLAVDVVGPLGLERVLQLELPEPPAGRAVHRGKPVLVHVATSFPRPAEERAGTIPNAGARGPIPIEDARGKPLRGEALRGKPLRGKPLRGTPLREKALRGKALRRKALRGKALRGKPLRAAP